MKCKVNVTFEYMTRQPDTHKMPCIEATGPQTIAARALREAKKVLKPKSWSSIVVLLQRLDEPENEG